MPLSFTKYALSEDRLFMETGVLTIRCEEILLYRVRDISIRITLGQRIFGVGSIIIRSSDRSCPALELKNVKNPREVKETIHQTVEKMKLQRRMRVGEVMGGEHIHDDEDFEDACDDDFKDEDA